MATRQRLIPTGKCWCGCEGEPKLGSFFLAGHDRVAESAVIKLEFGSVPEFLVHYGYGPGGRNPKQELEDLKSR